MSNKPDKEATLKEAMLYESNFRFTMPFHKFIYEAMESFSASQNSELLSTIEEKDNEIERLKGLIEKLFRDDRFSPELFNEDWIENELEKFKLDNDL